LTRQTAVKQISHDLAPGDPAAVFTASGQGNVGFTDDKGKLLDAVNRLLPRPIGRSAGGGMRGRQLLRGQPLFGGNAHAR